MEGATHGCDNNVCVLDQYVKSISRIAYSDLKKEKTMQLRAIMLVDLDVEDFSAAAAMEQELNTALEKIKKANIFSRLFKSFNYLVWGDV